MGLEHLRAWKKIALVTDIEWMIHMTSLFGWMTPGEMKHFPTAEQQQAIDWVASSRRGKKRSRIARVRLACTARSQAVVLRWNVSRTS